MDPGVHPTLHSKCYHQIMYAKLNLKIEYPPSYTRKIWNYKKMIKRKNWLCQSQRTSCKLDLTVLNLLTQDISDAITSSKLKHYEGLANKLANKRSKNNPQNLLENTKNICKWY